MIKISAGCNFWGNPFSLQKTLRENNQIRRIFPHSDWIRRDTSHLSIFSPSAGKYEPEKSPYLDTFHAVRALWLRTTQYSTYSKYY